jgi:hypothetical protein
MGSRMDNLTSRKDAEQFLIGLRLRIPEEDVRKIVNALRSDTPKYRIYKGGIDRKTGATRTPISSKGTVDKIKKLYDEGELKPYLEYLKITAEADGSEPSLTKSKETELNPMPTNGQKVTPALQQGQEEHLDNIRREPDDPVASRLYQQQNQSDIREIIRKLETFIVTIGNQQLDAATVLQKIWGELEFGKTDYEIAGLVGKEFKLENAGIDLFNATHSLLARLSLHKIVDKEQRLMPNGPRSPYHQTYWTLTDFGKEIVQFLERANRKH